MSGRVRTTQSPDRSTRTWHDTAPARLDYGEAGTHTEAAATVIGEGETMLDQLTVFLHGGDRTVDKSALQSWLGTAKDLRGEIVNAMTNPWLPDEPNTDLVANSGVRSAGSSPRFDGSAAATSSWRPST